MNRMPVLTLAAGLSLITAGIAQAQTLPAPRGNRDAVPVPEVAAGKAHGGGSHADLPGARGLLDRKADLGLTDDQAHVLDVIARRYDDQDKLLRDDKARAASRAAEQKEAIAVLTDAQRDMLRRPAAAAAPAPAADQARRN